MVGNATPVGVPLESSPDGVAAAAADNMSGSAGSLKKDLTNLDETMPGNSDKSVHKYTSRLARRSVMKSDCVCENPRTSRGSLTEGFI
jgi:hypothetical protein